MLPLCSNYRAESITGMGTVQYGYSISNNHCLQRLYILLAYLLELFLIFDIQCLDIKVRSSL